MTLVLEKTRKAELSQQQLESAQRIVAANRAAAASILLTLQKQIQSPTTSVRKIVCLV
jgi:hypothetical protein